MDAVLAPRRINSRESGTSRRRQRGGTAPLVGGRGVLQLLVLWKSGGEDGGNAEQDGGCVALAQLVDHDAGQDRAENLRDEKQGLLTDL